MIGVVFGKLTVLREAGRNERYQARFECRCVCGKVVIRIGAALRYAVARGQEPNCGCSTRVSGSVERVRAGAHRGKITVANYRDVARSFTAGQVERFTQIMGRHDVADCCYCSEKNKCPTAAEAVEMVLVEEASGLKGARVVEVEVRLDYTRQGMYV
jgi:hypothetical protein